MTSLSCSSLSLSLSLLLFLLELEIPVQLGLDIDDAIEQLADDLVSVGFERLVELVELLLGFLVYGGLRARGGTLVLCIEADRRGEVMRAKMHDREVGKGQ